MRLKAIVAVCALLFLAAAPPARAQSISTVDLAGTWEVFQLATPPDSFTGPAIRSYSGTVTFDSGGLVTAGMLTDNLSHAFTLTGGLAVSAAGVATGALTLDDGSGTGLLEIPGARLLLSKHTIVGASTVLGNPGLFTLVRLRSEQAFSLNDDVANDGDGTGNYTYHEITPSNQAALSSGDSSWTTGSIIFHDDPIGNSQGCTEADLVLADGTIRAQRSNGPTSFG